MLRGTPEIKPLTEADVLEVTCTTCKGPRLIGEDLTAFVVTGGDAKVIEPPKK